MEDTEWRRSQMADGGIWQCAEGDDIDSEVEMIEGVASEMAVCGGWDEDVRGRCGKEEARWSNEKEGVDVGVKKDENNLEARGEGKATEIMGV